MNRRRWFLKMLWRSLAHRRGKSLLLIAVLALASSLATALGEVSLSVANRVAEEVKRYGANLVLVPASPPLQVGSGALSFGTVTEPAYLDRRRVEEALAVARVQGGRSFRLRGALGLNGEVLAEGVDFAQARRLFPWWQVRGKWPLRGETLVGSDLAARLRLKSGDSVRLAGPGGALDLRVSGVVSTGGEEDALFLVELPELQRALGLPYAVTRVDLVVEGEGALVREKAKALQPLLPEAKVREVRQIARGSEKLLGKVRLLMVLVAAVVLICAGSSVAGTMSTTVLERGREIGLMKAMGGTRWEVLLIFSGEAALMGTVSGAIGYLAGSGIAAFVTRTVFDVSPEFVPMLAIVSVLVSLSLALVGSAGAMVAVFRLDPVRSLRGE